MNGQLLATGHKRDAATGTIEDMDHTGNPLSCLNGGGEIPTATEHQLLDIINEFSNKWLHS